MPPFPSLPPIDPTKYTWTPHDTTSKHPTATWRRRALGRESHWPNRPAHLRRLFLAGSASLAGDPHIDIDPARFQRAAENAWVRVRCEHPEVGMGSEVEPGDRVGAGGKDGKAREQEEVWMTCRMMTRGDEREAKAWVDETLFIQVGEQGYEFPEDCLRLFSKGGDHEARSLPSLRLRLLPRRGPQDSRPLRLASFGFIFCLDHHFVDGVGVRLVAGSFFRFLADALGQELAPPVLSSSSSSSESFVRWPESMQELAPSWIEMMNGHQQLDGTAFDTRVQRDTAKLISQRVSPLPLDPRRIRKREANDNE